MTRLSFLLLGLLGTYAGEPIPYAPAPNDTYFEEQWYLENIEPNTIRRGLDINARSAWSFSRGAGITIAIVDDGVDLAHPELTPFQVKSALYAIAGDNQSNEVSVPA